jgi:hypothetical protein
MNFVNYTLFKINKKPWDYKKRFSQDKFWLKPIFNIKFFNGLKPVASYSLLYNYCKYTISMKTRDLRNLN